MAINVERTLGKSSNDIAVVVASATVFETGNIAEHVSIMLWIFNTGLKALAACSIQVSPDPSNDANWITVDTVTFGTLAASGGAKLLLTGYPYVRVLANCAANESTTLDIGFTIAGQQI